MYLITINADKCDGCEACISACPAQYLVIEDGKAGIADGECLGCESCVEMCPNEAIKISEM